MAVIRTASAADRAALIAVHLKSWQDTYKGVLDATFLRDALPEILAERWGAVDFDGPDLTLLAETAQGVLGFVATLDESGEPYIYNFHMMPQSRGMGLGSRLLHAAADAWLARGATRTHLHVLQENTRALGYYERLGGTKGAMFEELLFGQPVRTIPVRWDDLKVLRDRTAP